MKEKIKINRSMISCYLIILPGLLLLTLFVYVPVVWAVFSSFFKFEVGSESKFIWFSNYIEYLTQDPTTWVSVLIMLALALFAACVKLTFPLFIAKLIHSLKNERWRYIYRIVFLVPIVVPGVATLLLWQSMMYGDQGMINTFLTTIGLGSLATGWLTDPDTALLAIMCIGFPFITGFEVLIYYAGLTAIPTSINEAAKIEGCTGIKKFFVIDLPLLLSQIKLILVLTIIGGLQGFEQLMILTGGGPGFRTTVPGLWMYYNAFSFQRMGYACAIGVLLFIMILGLTILNLKYFKSSEDIKGGKKI